MTDYREPFITREHHERVIAEVRAALQAKQLNLNEGVKMALRKEGADAVMRAAVKWLESNEERWLRRNGESLPAGRFIIWVLRSLPNSPDGLQYDIEAGRTAR